MMRATTSSTSRSSSGEGRSSSSCAACKLLKRRCTPNCIFAPHFRSDESKKFAKVHKVFGASNVSKILTEVPADQRDDTVNSLAYEADARLRDPVYGCIGAIANLQCKMAQLQHDLALARARLARARLYAVGGDAIHPPPPPPHPILSPLCIDDGYMWCIDLAAPAPAPPPPSLPDLVPLCAELARSFEEDVFFVSEQRLMDDLTQIPFGL